MIIYQSQSYEKFSSPKFFCFVLIDLIMHSFSVEKEANE